MTAKRWSPLSYPNTPGEPYQPTQVAPTAGQYGVPVQAPYGQGHPHAGQAPYPGYGQQPQAAWGPGGGAPPTPPKKSNRALFLWLTGGALVLVVLLVIALVVVLTRDKGPGSSPNGAVQTYLDGLANSDAKKVLGVVRTPPSEKLLTDDILRKQQEIAKITAITVSEPTNNFGSSATVKATYKFGDRNADVDYRLTKSDGKWTVDNGVLSVDVSNIKVPKLTLFGVDISNDTKVYVFPGPLLWGSGNPNFTATTDDDKEFPLGGDYYVSSSVKADLSTQGKSAVNKAVDAYLANCATSTSDDASTDRPGCGQDLYRTAVPGSVRWTKPTDLSDLRYSIGYDDPNKVDVLGQVNWSATYASPSSGPSVATDSDFMNGSVDLSQNPPTYTPDR
ncbi:hypothetical protein [Gordonia sp. NPDC003429]